MNALVGDDGDSQDDDEKKSMIETSAVQLKDLKNTVNKVMTSMTVTKTARRTSLR